jgi:hypothetical protein
MWREPHVVALRFSCPLGDMPGANAGIPKSPKLAESECGRNRRVERRRVTGQSGRPDDEQESTGSDEEHARCAGRPRVAEPASPHQQQPDGQNQHGESINRALKDCLSRITAGGGYHCSKSRLPLLWIAAFAVLIPAVGGSILPGRLLGVAVVAAVVLAVPLSIEGYRRERNLARALWRLLTRR